MREEGELQGEVARDLPLGLRDRGRRSEGALYPFGEAVDPSARGPSGVQRVLQLAKIVEDDPEHRLQRRDARAAGLRLAPDRFGKGDAKIDLRSVAALRSLRARRLAAPASTLPAARRPAATPAGGRLHTAFARVGEAAEGRSRSGIESRLRTESPASPGGLWA